MTDEQRLARALGISDAAGVQARLEAAYASPEGASDLADAVLRHTWGRPEDNDLLWYVDDLFAARAEQAYATGQSAPAGLATWEEKVASLRDM